MFARTSGDTGLPLCVVAGCTTVFGDPAAGKSLMSSAEKKLFMRCPWIFLFLLVIVCIFIAGCTQSPGPAPVTTVVPVTSPPPVLPATTPPTAVPPSTPQPVVTIVRQAPLFKNVKDSQLMFALQVPEEWNISTRRLNNPENFEGFMYQTDLVGNNTFYITTFTDYRSREQNFRDAFLEWSPAPNRTIVTINGIGFDRFESTANGTTQVGYVARKGSTNEQGYLSVLYFSADTCNQYQKEDFEKVVSSFRYFTSEDASTVPGEEIYKIIPPKGESGGTKSTVGGSSSGSSSSGGSPPSSGGCHGPG